MMHDVDLPMFLWIEACNTTAYILHWSYHRILKDKTPEEAFAGDKPKVSHFRVFGCLVYIHVHDEKRSKLDPSSLKGIFVGCNLEMKYKHGRQYNLPTARIICCNIKIRPESCVK
jgi:hypothetical protein